MSLSLEEMVVVENYFAVRSFLIGRTADDIILHFACGVLYRSQVMCCVLKSSLSFKVNTLSDRPTLRET